MAQVVATRALFPVELAERLVLPEFFQLRMQLAPDGVLELRPTVCRERAFVYQCEVHINSLGRGRGDENAWLHKQPRAVKRYS